LASEALPATPASGEKKSLMLLDAEPPADFFSKKNADADRRSRLSPKIYG
jgi:hypothetical protein